MSRYILTVTLNPALDRMIYPHGREILSAGGKGLNVSRALHGLHVPTVATGILGGTAGEAVRRLLTKEKVRNDFIFISGETRTNVTGRDRRRVMGIGPNVDGAALEAFEKKVKKLIRQASVVTFNGRNAEGAPADYYARLIGSARRQSIRTVLDSSGPEFRAGLKAKPYLIKPNAREAQEALVIRVQSLPQVKKALLAFRKMGIIMALISLGGRGAAGIFKEEVWHCGVPKVTIKNNVGCGDAFLGAFLGAVGEKRNFAQALAWATAAGTVSCQSDIPGNVERVRIEAFVNKVRLKKL